MEKVVLLVEDHQEVKELVAQLNALNEEAKLASQKFNQKLKDFGELVGKEAGEFFDNLNEKKIKLYGGLEDFLKEKGKLPENYNTDDFDISLGFDDSVVIVSDEDDEDDKELSEDQKGELKDKLTDLKDFIMSSVLKDHSKCKENGKCLHQN